MSHCRLLVWSSALDWVGGSDGPPSVPIWQARKISAAQHEAESIADGIAMKSGAATRKPDSNI
jgi:hypothetical protein